MSTRNNHTEKETLPAALQENHVVPTAEAVAYTGSRFPKIDLLANSAAIIKVRNYLPHLFLALAVLINLVSIRLHFSGDYLSNSISARFAAFTWVMSVIFAGIAAFLFTSPLNFQFFRSINKQRNFKFIRKFWKNLQKLKVWSLPVVLFVALVIRIIPIQINGLWLDEWYWLESAKSILNGTVFTPFGFMGDFSSNLPAFPVAWVLSIIKNPTLSVRLTSVIFSLIAITVFYYLTKQILGGRVALVGAILLTFSVWDIHMSDLGFVNTNINPMLVAAVLYLLYRLFSNNYSIRTIYAIALLISLCVHQFYVAALLLIPAMVVFAIHFLRIDRILRIREGILIGVFFFICLSPVVPKLVLHSDQTLGRHLQFLETNVNQAQNTKSSVAYYLEQLNLLGQDYFQGEQTFSLMSLWGLTIDPMIQILSLLGIAIIVVQTIRRKLDNRFWWIIVLTFFIQLIVPLVILYRENSTWREFATLPIIYLFSAYSIYTIAKLIKDYATHHLHSTRGLVRISLFILVTLYFLFSINWYKDFFNGYLRKLTNYESGACQAASELINTNVPHGATIYLPNEMCYPLITVLYQDDDYHFIQINNEEDIPSIKSGTFLIILNSINYGSYHLENIQKVEETIVSNRDVKLLTLPSNSQPVIYYIY